MVRIVTAAFILSAWLGMAMGLYGCRGSSNYRERRTPVTGSHLPPSGSVTSSPVKVYSRSRLGRTGMSRVGDAVGRGSADAVVEEGDLLEENAPPSADAPRREVKILVQPDLDDDDE